MCRAGGVQQREARRCSKYWVQKMQDLLMARLPAFRFGKELYTFSGDQMPPEKRRAGKLESLLEAVV